MAVMIANDLNLTMTVVAEGWFNGHMSMAFSRIAATIPAKLSVRYVMTGCGDRFVTPKWLTIPPCELLWR